MTRSAAFLILLVTFLPLVACRHRPVEVLPAGSIFRPAEAVATVPDDPAAPRIAVIPLHDSRPMLASHFPPAGIPVIEFFALFYPEITSHPARSISPPLDVPANEAASRAIVLALQNEMPGATIEAITLPPHATIPASYDLVVRGNLHSTTTRHVAPDYGLNFFTIVDLSFLPKVFGAPTRIMSGELILDVEVRERWSERLIANDSINWKSPTYFQGFYTCAAGYERLPHALYRDWAEEALVPLARNLSTKIKENVN